MELKMGSPIAPRLLRALVAWPSTDFRHLERTLSAPIGSRKLSLKGTSIETLANELQTTGYYHILLIDPAELGKLEVEKRQSLLARLHLVILAPGEVEYQQVQSMLAGAHAGIAFQEALSMPQARTLLAALLESLVNQQTLVEACERAWSSAEIGGPPPCIYITRSDEAIWPPQAADVAGLKAAKKKSLHPSLPNQAGSGIPAVLIQHAQFTTVNQVEGDQINIQRGGKAPDSIENTVQGDQVNVQRFNGAPVNIQQSAGGDQVNVNRVEGTEAIHIQQSAGRDQSNVNRIVKFADPDQQIEHPGNSSFSAGEIIEETPLTCPRCGSVIEAGLSYCENCGTILTRQGGAQ